MPQHRVKLIVNPSADLGRAWIAARDLRPIVEEFGGADWAGTVYPTHAVELARQAGEQGYELVIAAGGDGTSHEVLNGLMQVPKERVKTGVVPLVRQRFRPRNRDGSVAPSGPSADLHRQS
jgi:diacylglycerol kinase family enzyme